MGEVTRILTAIDAGEPRAAERLLPLVYEELRGGGYGLDWFFLAMAEWKMDNKDAALAWYEKAVEWMEMNSPDKEELVRFRGEAAELLGLRRRYRKREVQRLRRPTRQRMPKRLSEHDPMMGVRRIPS